MNRTRCAASRAGWAIPLLFVLVGCSDSTSPTGLTVFGGPDNPAPDGSYTASIISENGIASRWAVWNGISPW
jgi:hypothetical protein